MPDIEPLTAERLDAIEADLDAAWSEAGETSPVVARAVNGSYILLARYQRLTAEVDRLRTLITAPDGGRIPTPLLDELHTIAAESGCEHRDTVAVVAETAYAVGSEQAGDLRAELADAKKLAVSGAIAFARLAESEAEVLKRGKANRALSGLYAEACRKLDAVRAFSAGMREYCSPYGVSLHYANQLDEVLNAAPVVAEVPCSTCDGTGWIKQEGQIGVPGSGCTHGCPDCTVGRERLAAGELRDPDDDSDPDICATCGHAECDGEHPEGDAPVVAEATQADDEWPDLDEDYEPPCGDPECRQMHCGRCKEHSGSMGHYASVCHRLGGLNGPTVPHHQCCPGNCENAAPDAVPAAAADRPVA